MQLSFISAFFEAIKWTMYVCPGSVEGTRAPPDWPNAIVPENVNVMHCPGVSTTGLLSLSLLPPPAFTRVIPPDMQLVAAVEEDEEDVVVVVIVVEEVEDDEDDDLVVDDDDEELVVEDTAFALGTKTTSFGLSQPCQCPECPWSSCEAVVTRQL